MNRLVRSKSPPKRNGWLALFRVLSAESCQACWQERLVKLVRKVVPFDGVSHGDVPQHALLL
jgi:hypothetical protein